MKIKVDIIMLCRLTVEQSVSSVFYTSVWVV